MELVAKSPHSVKRWQLDGTDFSPQTALARWSAAVGGADTRFSAWTPINNKSSNQQLFEERSALIAHWFDLWTDRQRKHLLHSLLTGCSKSQLKFCRDWLLQTVPVTRADFTAVLPRCLSLYVMSFLTPRDLCRAAQVSWTWRVLAEQDCLWAGRTVRRGWFLPYSPAEREYGCWKRHYVSCVSALDCLTPREAAERYGTLNPPCSGAREEEDERRREREIRRTVRERVEEHKKASLRSRRTWGSSVQAEGGKVIGRAEGERLRPALTLGPAPVLSGPLHASLNPKLSPTPLGRSQAQPSLSAWAPPLRDSVSKGLQSLSSYTTRPVPRAPRTSLPSTPIPLLLLSNRVPAYELVLSGVRGGVIPVLYDHRGTLQALLAQVERALGGHSAQRLGLLAPGGTDEFRLLQGCSVTERSVLFPGHREFWEKLCGWVIPPEDGGGLDIFSPLAASASGVALMQTLSTMTGLEVQAPMGTATGCFQNILGGWSDSGGVRAGAGPSLAPPSGPPLAPPPAPPLRYVCEEVLQGWGRQAQWLDGALQDLRPRLGPQLPLLSQETRGRALGQCLWEVVGLEGLSVCEELSLALTEGLSALSTHTTTRPVEFLTLFLGRWGEKEGQSREDKDGGKGAGGERSCNVSLTERGQHSAQSPNLELPQAALDWRGAVCVELLHSEKRYVAQLGAVLTEYHRPLDSALRSNRAVLSSAHIHMILTPVTSILEVNRLFLSELGARLEVWGAEQCVGDVCVKFCSKMRVYTNYLNNYPTALRTIDKCREMNPAFRAFLKRVDRTLATHMLSLQELLLCPVWRVDEYVTLLQAISLHTLPAHPDHTHLCSALNTLIRYRDFIRKLKSSSERDVTMQETQRMIRACPNLCEGNRQLISSQEALLLRSPDDDITDSLRTYEQVADVGLFLFNDALVLTGKSVRHTPFSLSLRSTHTFLASVALHSLSLREISHTRYVNNAFVLEGPSRAWVCATETEEERERFLSALRSAMLAALSES